MVGLHRQDPVTLETESVGHILRQGRTDRTAGLSQPHFFGHACQSSTIVRMAAEPGVATDALGGILPRAARLNATRWTDTVFSFSTMIFDPQVQGAVPIRFGRTGIPGLAPLRGCRGRHAGLRVTPSPLSSPIR